VARAFQFGGLVLIALAALYAALALRRRALLAAPCLAAVGLLVPGELPQATMPDGTRVQVIESRDSFYGNVRVVEYAGTGGRTRELVIDGLVQGGIDLASGQSVYEYSHVIEALVAAAVPAGGRCLVIGLGPGVMPARLAARGLATEAVDIDPAVVDAARRHFALPESIPVHLADARHFLASASARYDAIVLDVFNGDTTPAHLVSREALLALKSRLAPGGVVAINLVASLSGDDSGSAAVLRTVRSVFPRVRVHPLFEPGAEGAFGNIAVLAGSDELPLPLRPAADLPPQLAVPVARALRRVVPAPEAATGLILTDDFNPSDFLDLALKEAVRRRILETTPAAILLG
jgi:spermidine synthase